MIDAITGAFTGIKAAAEVTQGLLALKTDAAVSAKAVELNRVIFDVQQQLIAIQADYAAVVARERDLEAQIGKLKDWAHDKQRYELHELAPRTLVYRVKPGMKGAEPMHDLCPRCYQEGIKSILQAAGVKEGCHALKCPEPKCGAVYLGERCEALSYTVPRDPDWRL
ncbi:MAG TPA: hypothetical protein PLN31_09530 [Azoarcus taiwanensis]|nr:hypothetical protein [Azoarcus taiwanensis]